MTKFKYPRKKYLSHAAIKVGCKSNKFDDPHFLGNGTIVFQKNLCSLPVPSVFPFKCKRNRRNVGVRMQQGVIQNKIPEFAHNILIFKKKRCEIYT